MNSYRRYSNKKKENPEQWKLFIIGKNRIKKIFYDSYCQQYKHGVVRGLRMLKYVYDVDITEEIEKTEIILKPFLKFKHKLDILR